MKFKKLFAGVAAAATLLGGMAFGATANAADQYTITLQGETVADHTFTAYKIADYVDAVANKDAQKPADMTSVGLDTVDGWENDIKAAAETASAADSPYKKQTLPAEYTGNPAQWVANWNTTTNAAGLRAFAAELAKTADTQKGVANNGSAITVPTPGWYLVTDSNGLALLVGTTYTSGDKTFTTLNGAELGTVIVKNQFDALAPAKKIVEAQTVAKDGLSGSAQVGDYVKYQITTKVPNLTGYEGKAFSFTLTDSHKAGLDLVSDETHPVTVTVRNGADAENVPSNWDGQSTSEYDWKYRVSNYTPAGGTEQENVLFFLDNYIEKVGHDAAYVGQPITVSYYMKVTKDALHSTQAKAQANVNKVSLDYSAIDGSTTKDKTVDGNATSLYTYDTAFTKTDAKGNALANAGFKVQNVKGQWLSQDENGLWSVAKDEASAKELQSGADGVVSLKGLGEGAYTVKETTVPDGYMKSVAPTFTVKFADQDANTVLNGKFSATYAETDKFGLVKPGENTATVKNITNLTELPKTGAAGIAMFVALGVVLAGAAAAVYGKSRRAGSALHA